MEVRLSRIRQSLANFLLVFISFICGIAFVEIGWHFLNAFTPSTAFEPEYDRRYMLFGAEKGSAFRNVGEIFTYQPDSLIQSATYYDTRQGLAKEYEYKFNTNNLGLVQKKDIEAARPSVLILGDSFTEGQGAEPWIESLIPFFLERNYQAMNGGLLGTGLRQWILLHEHLKGQNIVISKLIIVFITDDFERSVWNFPDHVQNCLSNYLNCVGDEEFFGMPPAFLRHAFLLKLRSYRIGLLNQNVPLRKLLPATAIAYREARRLAAGLHDRLNSRLHNQSKQRVEMKDSLQAGQIRHFSDLYGKDVIFVHIPVLEELRKGLDVRGLSARAVLEGAGAKLFDGFERCGMTDSDYHVNDEHPNSAGYAKIAACVREAAMEIM